MKQLFIISALIILAVTMPARSEGYTGYTRCAEQDSLALVAFYHGTGGPDWISNAKADFGMDDISDFVLEYYSDWHPHAGMGKWLEGPVKDWFGVRLEKQQIGTSNDSIWRVVDLFPVLSRREAGNNNLQGYIPKEMGFLTALKYFRVNGNSGLAGSELPAEMFHPTLEVFDVEACQLEGVISDELRKCTKINYFNIRSNSFTDVPLMDFLSHDHLLEHFGRGRSILWYYTNRIPYTTLEKNVDYFLSNGLNPQDIQYEARQQFNMGIEREIIVNQGDDVKVTTNVGGRDAEYTWSRNGVNTWVTAPAFTINNIQQEVFLTARIKNEYIQFNDLNTGGYDNVNTSRIYVRFKAVAPVIKKIRTSYSGTKVEMVFDKPMAVPSSEQAASFAVSSDGQSIAGSDIIRTGKNNEIYILTLENPINPEVPVTLSFSNGSVHCDNGGALEEFVNLEVSNLTRPTPVLVRATTRTDGSGVFLEFDRFIDPSTLIKNDFAINADYEVDIFSVVLVPGRISGRLSKTVELVLGSNLPPNDDNIKVSYSRGGLTGLHSGPVNSVSEFNIENLVDDNLTTVTLTINDGSGGFSNLYVAGNLSALPFALTRESDHVWTATRDLPNGEYDWNVYERVQTTTYDTTYVVDNGTTYITITPNIQYEDVLVSVGTNLVFNVLDKVYDGITTFDYKIYHITFILDMSSYVNLYPDLPVNPYLMGIDNDWTNGLEMEPHPDGENRYIVKVSYYDIGDNLTFNFRNNNNWENQTPAMRSHTVKGNDVVLVGFGQQTVNIESLKSSLEISIYPNPANTYISIQCSNPQDIKNIRIYNLHGQLIKNIEYSFNKPINVSTFPNGVYILNVVGLQGEVHFSRFIKQ